MVTALRNGMIPKTPKMGHLIPQHFPTRSRLHPLQRMVAFLPHPLQHLVAIMVMVMPILSMDSNTGKLVPHMDSNMASNTGKEIIIRTASSMANSMANSTVAPTANSMVMHMDSNILTALKVHSLHFKLVARGYLRLCGE